MWMTELGQKMFGWTPRTPRSKTLNLVLQALKTHFETAQHSGVNPTFISRIEKPRAWLFPINTGNTQSCETRRGERERAREPKLRFFPTNHSLLNQGVDPLRTTVTIHSDLLFPLSQGWNGFSSSKWRSHQVKKIDHSPIFFPLRVGSEWLGKNTSNFSSCVVD